MQAQLPLEEKINQQHIQLNFSSQAQEIIERNEVLLEILAEEQNIRGVPIWYKDS